MGGAIISTKNKKYFLPDFAEKPESSERIYDSHYKRKKIEKEAKKTLNLHEGKMQSIEVREEQDFFLSVKLKNYKKKKKEKSFLSFYTKRVNISLSYTFSRENQIELDNLFKDSSFDFFQTHTNISVHDKILYECL